MTEKLITALQNPALYDHPVEGFEVIQTHISWVILTGPWAYKVKKPMNFGFLDFTSLEKRRHFCAEELRLNQRLAPDIYDRVIPISGTESEPRLDDGNPVIEYALRMRQFPQEELLSRSETEGRLQAADIDQLATIIADFHAGIPVAGGDTPWGEPEQVHAPVRQNFEQIRPLLSDPADLGQLDLLEGWAEATFQRLQGTFSLRREQGHIRECHGDIHLGNITRFNGELRIFDCIEFNDEFKWIDTISDVGFLVMDLEDRGHPDLAARLINRYLELTGDYPALALLDYYKAYRAMVRAKVGLFRLGEESLGDEQRAAILAQYRSYTGLAERCARIPQPYLLTMHGVSGTGKSTVSRALVEKLGMVRIRSDVERKRLHGLSESARTRSEMDSGIYTANSTEETYQRLAVLAASVLLCGVPVVIDATFLRREQRDQFHRLAEDLGMAHLVISCMTDVESARAWVEQRTREGRDASEAGPEVLEHQLQTREPLEDDELRYTRNVEPLQADSVDQLVEKLRRVLDQGGVLDAEG